MITFARKTKATSQKQSPVRSKANGKPRYQPLPDLPPEEYESLKADIAERGIQYHLIQDEFGNTLDGHQRERIAEELGIKRYPIKVLAGLTEQEKWHLALTLNIKRRHLTTAQKQALIEQELKRTPDITNNWMAEILAVDDKTVAATRKKLVARSEIPNVKKLRGKDGKKYPTQWRSVLANTANELRVAREVVGKLPTSCSGRMIDTVTASRHARRYARAEVRNGRVTKKLSLDSIAIHHCPFQKLERVASLRPGSVHLLLTDVPFGKEFLPELSDLAAFAERILVPGGLFVTYSGQYYLPQVLAAFGKHLTYRWLAMSSWQGDSNLIHPLDIASQCKPILIFSKGPWKKRDRWGDTFFVEAKEKTWHPWQQSLEEVQRLVRYFSKPGDLVVDPCSGGATTAAACHSLGRRCISCDIEKKCVVNGQKRLAMLRTA